MAQYRNVMFITILLFNVTYFAITLEINYMLLPR